MQGVLPSHLFFANRATSDFHLGIDCYQEATATPTKQRWHEGLQGVQEGKVSFLVILKPQWWNFFTPNKQPFFRIAMQRLLIFTSVGQDPKGAFLVKVKITANDEFRSPNLNLIPRNSDNIKPKKTCYLITHPSLCKRCVFKRQKVESNICGATIKRNDAFGFGRALASKSGYLKDNSQHSGHILLSNCHWGRQWHQSQRGDIEIPRYQQTFLETMSYSPRT